MEHPDIKKVNLAGYVHDIKQTLEVYQNACDVCIDYEAVVNFRGIELCKCCAKERGITIL